MNIVHRRSMLPAENNSSKRIEVVFGAPSKDCRFVGICEIHLAGEANLEQEKICRCRKAKAIAQVTANNRLVFYFIRHTIDRTTYSRYFASNSFRMHEPYFISDDVTKALGLPQGSFIPCRNYTVTHLGTHLAVSFDLVGSSQRTLQIAYRSPRWWEQLSA